MKKIILLAAMLFMPMVVNATYSHSSYYGNNKTGYSKHHTKKNYYSYYYNYYKKSHKKKNKKYYGNPLIGHKMPKGCKWVWVNGKKETKCGNKNHKMKLAKFCAKYPNSRKCKGKPPVTNVSEPAPLALLGLSLLIGFFVRRKIK